MNPNSMTAHAAARREHPAEGKRPPVTAWTLRLVLAITDTRTSQGDVSRLFDRMAGELAPEARTAVSAAVLACMEQIRNAEDIAAEAAEWAGIPGL